MKIFWSIYRLISSIFSIRQGFFESYRVKKWPKTHIFGLVFTFELIYLAIRTWKDNWYYLTLFEAICKSWKHFQIFISYIYWWKKSDFGQKLREIAKNALFWLFIQHWIYMTWQLGYENIIGNSWHYSTSILSLKSIFKYSFRIFIDHKGAFLDDNYAHFWPLYLMLNWFDLAIRSWYYRHYSTSI